MNSIIDIQSDLKDVDLAFRQIEFAYKLKEYCTDKHLIKTEFDISINSQSKCGIKTFQRNSFKTYEEIVDCAEINYKICFGASAIALDNAFDSAGFVRLEHDISLLVYMVRCAFAHDIADPKWKVKQKLLKTVKIPLDGNSLDVDLEKLNGQSFDSNHIGGLITWYRIKDLSIAMIKEKISKLASQG